MSPTKLFIFISLFFLTISLLPSSASSSSDPPLIGVTYTNRGTNNRVHQQQLVTTLESLKINSIRLTDSDPEVIRSFSYSSISLLITIPNSLIPSIASNQSEALHWLNRHVTPFYPRVHISLISVGNNILVDQSQTYSNLSSKFLLSAVSSVRNALDELGIDKISVSTTFSFADVITSPFPPSSSEFKETVAESVIKPLLNFLSETNSSFLINIYPYNMYRTTVMIPLGYAIFQEPPFMYRDDLVTGLRYRNLYDVMVDSVVTAMASLGHESVPVIVTETGWPSVDEANKLYAEMYLKGLVRHVRSGKGTPLRKNAVAETYLFELFDKDDENDNVGSNDLTRQWGILNHDMSQKYNIDFTSGAAPIRPDVIDSLWKMLVCIWLLGTAIGSAVRVCDVDDLPMCARSVFVGVLSVMVFWWITNR